jgi:hypothetical protein
MTGTAWYRALLDLQLPDRRVLEARRAYELDAGVAGRMVGLVPLPGRPADGSAAKAASAPLVMPLPPRRARTEYDPFAR